MAVDALPSREKARERALRGRLDLLAQGCQRSAAQATQNLDVAPFKTAAGGCDLTACELTGALELAQVCARERTAGARVTSDQLGEGIVDVREERLGQAAGRHGAKRVAIEPGLVGGHVALLTAEAQRDRAPFAPQLGEQRVGIDLLEHAFAHLRRRQIADAAQYVVQLVATGRGLQRRAALQIVLHALQGAGVDQLAQLLLAEQLTQQVMVERQRGGAALGGGRVSLVHVGGDVVEQQRGRERRGGLSLNLDERDLAAV